MHRKRGLYGFFNSAVDVLQTLVIALGAGLGIWGGINLMEGYGNDNRATRSCEKLRTRRRAIVARNFPN